MGGDKGNNILGVPLWATAGVESMGLANWLNLNKIQEQILLEATDDSSLDSDVTAGNMVNPMARFPSLLSCTALRPHCHLTKSLSVGGSASEHLGCLD